MSYSGHFAIEPIFILRQIMEQKAKQNLHLRFVDADNTHDLTPRPKFLNALRHHGVSSGDIRVVQHMYHSANTSLKTPWGTTNSLNVRIGGHQGSVLSPSLFMMLMDDLWAGVGEWPLNKYCLQVPLIKWGKPMKNLKLNWEVSNRPYYISQKIFPKST